jgi:hypothetical protein
MTQSRRESDWECIVAMLGPGGASAHVRKRVRVMQDYIIQAEQSHRSSKSSLNLYHIHILREYMALIEVRSSINRSYVF